MTPSEFRDLESMRLHMTTRARRVTDHLLDHPTAAVEAHPNFSNRLYGLSTVEREAVTLFFEIAGSYRWRPAVEVQSHLEEYAWTPRAGSRAQWEMTQ